MRVAKLNPHTIRHWATEGFEQARVAREAGGSPIRGFIHQGVQCLLDRLGDLAFQRGNLHGQAQPGALVFTQDALCRGIECAVQLLLVQAPGIELAARLDQFFGATRKYPFLPRRDQPGSQVEIVAGGKVAHQAEQAVFTPLPVSGKCGSAPGVDEKRWETSSHSNCQNATSPGSGSRNKLANCRSANCCGDGSARVIPRNRAWVA